MKYALVAALAAPALVSAQQPVWAQCGGIGWSGGTTCASGTYCSVLNPYYSQCLPGSAGTTAATTTTTRATTTRATTTAVTTTAVTTNPVTTTRATTTLQTTTRTSSAPVATGLDAAMKAKGKKYFGFCADPGTLTGSSVNILKAEGGQVTPENSMKWDAIEPTQNQFSFGNSDTLANWATTNGKLIRGHTVIWHSQIPNWVTQIRDKATLTSVIQNHIATVFGRYKGKIYAWDVANELFEDSGALRSDVWTQVFGDTTFLDVAYKAARQADPGAKLCLNDYNLDYSGSKLTNFVALVKTLIGRGVPIDCVGTQSHLVVGNGAIPSYANTLTQLASTGLEVQITELDIRLTTPGSTATRAQQATDYTTVTKACMQQSACAGITVWGVSDANSWIPGVFSGQGEALIWDSNYNKKTAVYNGILGAINGS